MDLAERSSEATGRHPWEIARFRFFRRLFERHGALRHGKSWLDVGAGDTWFAQQLVATLPSPSTVACWDINYGPDELSRLQAELPDSVLVTAAQPQGRFDMLLLLDVIEHVEDDYAFLVELVEECLATDGTVVISVPAYQSLFGRHDRFLHHYRRYSPRQCRALIASARLETTAQGGLFHSLLPVRAAQVALERGRSLDDDESAAGLGAWSRGPATTRAIIGMFDIEATISLALGMRQLAVPGLSYWAVARRAR